MYQVQLFPNATNERINKWLADRPDLDIVDIKLSVPAVLAIYRESSRAPETDEHLAMA